jgi:hypothetical protein
VPLPPHSRLPIRTILALAVWGFLSLGAAYAGTCVNRQDGTDTVQSCDNGSYTVTDRHGRRWVYGTPNAGFERYPGQAERPVYRRGMIEPEGKASGVNLLPEMLPIYEIVT